MSDPSHSYTLSAHAYSLPLLHAARYTSNTVLGIFLGTIDPSTRSITVSSAIPLLHHYTSLSPVAEAGISLIQAEAERVGKKLVGLYVAHEGPTSGLGRVGERILEGLREDFDGAFGLVVDETRLSSGQAPYDVYLASSPSKPLASSEPTGLPSTVKLENEGVVSGTLDLIRKDEVHKLVVDFDDHVEDSDADWLDNAPVRDTIGRRFA